MNVIFLSPQFPPQFFLFCTALRDQGATVLAIADLPFEELRPELRGALSGYYQVRDLERYDDVHRAVSFLSWKHGKIDRIDSLNEHWLELEAKVRVDFNIPGQRPEDTLRNRSKTRMRAIFQAAGVPCSEGEPIRNPQQVRAFAKRHGYPLVIKPDVGVGAARTYKLTSDAELAAALAEPLEHDVIERFERGRLTSFDGLVDREGRIVFATSHLFSAGIMDIVNEHRPMHYYTRREIPSKLESLGIKTLAAFGVRERFFHIEFFEDDAGDFRALEINVRPPGGFTTDLMNFSADIDVYRLWAEVITGKDLADFKYERRFHAAHAGRRRGLRYRHSDEELTRLLGDRLLLHRDVPTVLAGAMGDDMYLLRDADEGKLLEAIALIEQQA